MQENEIKVDFLNPEYQKSIDDWKLIRDCVLGETYVKNMGKKYLPCPQTFSQSRYKSYLERAVFYNATGRTRDGLVGAIFRKDPVITIDKDMEFLIDDCDGYGVGIVQSSKFVSNEVISLGRCGLLVDYPSIEGEISASEISEYGIKPTIVPYTAENIINWETKKIGSQNVISMVVLRECIQSKMNMFQNIDVIQHRVLFLDDYNRYRQQIYIDNSLQSDIEVRGADGNYINFIPFIFIGSENCYHTIDKPPLIDIAKLNIAHYRNSADYEEACFLVGQPSLVITGLSKNWMDLQFPNGITVGSRAVLPLPEGGDAKFIQVQPNSFILEALQRKEAQMIALGARLIENQRQGVEAAESIRLRQSGEASILANIADNITRAFNISIKYVQYFIGSESEFTFTLNKDFFVDAVDPSLFSSLMQGWQFGVYSINDLRDYLRDHEVIDSQRTNEDIQQDIDSEGPKGGLSDLQNK